MLLAFVFSSPFATSQTLPDVKVLTWSNDIKIGDSYQWNVNQFDFNGVPVTNTSEYGIKEGSVITLTVNVKLSDINVAEYLSGNETLPSVSDYVSITVDGSPANITIFYEAIFILPTNITLADGQYLNALWGATFYNQVFFSAQNELNYTTGEYIEYNSSTTTQERFSWDLYLGVLKTVSVHWQNDLNLEVAVVNPEQFSSQTTSSSSSSSSETTRSKKSNSPLPIFMGITALAAIALLRFKLKKEKLR